MSTTIHLSDAKDLPGLTARYLAMAIMEASGDTEGVAMLAMRAITLTAGDLSITAPEDSRFLTEEGDGDETRAAHVSTTGWGETVGSFQPVVETVGVTATPIREDMQTAPEVLEAAAAFAPPAPPPPVDPNAEVDSAGVPWSADLHSTPPKKKNDGTWRARRNLAAAAPNTPPMPAPVTVAPPSAAAPPPPPPPPPAAPNPVSPGAVPSFAELMQINQRLLQRGLVMPTTIYDICTASNIALADISTDEAKRAIVAAGLATYDK